MKLNQTRRCPLLLGVMATATMVGNVPATSVFSPVDLTTGAVATTSSNPYGFPPERAIDGVTTGSNPDFNHTNNGPEEWLRIDLTEATQADELRIINRSDCCSDRLNGTIVRAFSDAAATVPVYVSSPVAGSPAVLNLPFNGTQSVKVIELRQTNQFLHVGEVQLLQKVATVLPLDTNLGLAQLVNLKVSQSSGTTANRALDGNTANFSITADGETTDQWWKADLGEVMQIQQVELFNRGDSNFPERLRDIKVEVLGATGAVVWTSPLLNPLDVLVGPGSILVDIQAANGGTPVAGRQIRVTRLLDVASSGPDAHVLSLGEVVITGGSRPDTDGDGMADAYETANGLNELVNDAAGDADIDGSSNLAEYEKGTNPQVADTDVDGLSDGVETGTGVFVGASDTGTDPLLADTDGDTIRDDRENGSGLWVSAANPGTNPVKQDSDGDGFNDQVENNSGIYVSPSNPGTNPNLADTDGDGFRDGLEVLYSTSNPTKIFSRPLRSGLVDLAATWRFNDASNPAQALDSVKSFAGTFENGAAYSDDGLGRSGLPGDRALDLGADANARRMRTPAGFINLGAVQDEVAFVFWQKLYSTAASTAFWAESPSSGGRGAQAHVTWSDGNIYWDTAGCCGGNTRTITSAPVNATNGGPVDFSEWRNIVIQKKGLVKEIWIDGVLIHSGTLSGTGTELPQDFTELLVGSDQGNTQMRGLIDDFSVYGDALTPAQIATLFGSGAANDISPFAIVPPNTDTDGDGMPDAYEVANNLSTTLDDTLADPDADGSPNIAEYARGTNPQVADTDGDGLKDGAETGTGIYVNASNTGTNPLDPDTDKDGFPDGLEVPALASTGPLQPGTSPLNGDTDGDGFGDYAEVYAGTNPKLDTSVPTLTPGLDLLAYWSFNNISNPAAARDSIYNANGVMVAGAAYTAAGGGRTGLPADYGLDLGTVQAGQRLLVKDATILKLTASQDQMAVSFWQKLDRVSSSFAFFGQSAAGTRLMGAHATWSNNIFYWDTAGTTGDCCNGAINRISGANPDIDLTQWHHFVFQKDNGTKEIWVDGQLIISGSNTGLLEASIQTLSIGSSSGTESTVGVMDDFAVYGDALTQDQIARLAVGESPTTIRYPKLEVGNVSMNPVTKAVTLEFTSVPGLLYSVQASENPEAGWPITLVSNLAGSAAATTTYTDNIVARYAPGAPPARLYYRIVLQ